jgi:hypothetical protein
MVISQKSNKLLEELQRFDIKIKTEAKIELQWSDEGPVYMVVARDDSDNWSFDYVDKNGKSRRVTFGPTNRSANKT